jgi:hypothetical protein
MGVAVSVVARSPGRATITATVMPLAGPNAHAGSNDILAHPSLKDTIEIEVHPRLGSDCDKPLLLPPHGSINIFSDSVPPNQACLFLFLLPLCSLFIPLL